MVRIIVHSCSLHIFLFNICHETAIPAHCTIKRENRNNFSKCQTWLVCPLLPDYSPLLLFTAPQFGFVYLQYTCSTWHSRQYKRCSEVATGDRRRSFHQLPGCQVVQLPSKSPPAHCSGLAIGLVDAYRAWFGPFRVLGVPWCWNNMGVSALTASFGQSSPFHHLGDENQSFLLI